MDKYYTPDISELHVGMEYERFNHLEGKWIKDYLDYSHFQTILNEEECDWSEHHIRVKYLDKEDIESFGFSHKNIQESFQTEIRNCQLFFGKKCIYESLEKNHLIYYIKYFIEDNHCVIRLDNNETKQKNIQIFNGEIKNKSELKKILKMIGVIDNG